MNKARSAFFYLYLIGLVMVIKTALVFDKYLLLDPKKEHSPQGLKVEIVRGSLNMRWSPPTELPNVLRGYRITYGNVTTDIKAEENSYSVDLGDRMFRACSVYTFQVAAVYRDSTYASASVKMKHKPTEVTKVECVALDNSTSIEVRWKPTNMPNECPDATLLVSASGSQLLNENTKEKIPEFEVTARGSFILEGLFPNAEYTLFIKNQRTFGYSDDMKCTVKTRELAPRWVTDEKAVCTSRSSISVSWTPPEDSNGKILRYWIKVTNSKDFSVSFYAVEGHYTRANIQHLDQEVEYTFIIWPENKAGNGTLSNNLSVYCF